MEFVIYGAGYRGKRLMNFLGEEKIAAFLDQDIRKIGSTYLNKPIITIKEYKVNYSNFMILISPKYTDEIEAFLEKNEVFQYSNLQRLPSEYNGYGNCSFLDICKELKKILHRSIYLYGVGPYSMMLYENLRQEFEVKLVRSDEIAPAFNAWVKQNCNDMEVIDVSGIPEKAQVLLTIRMSQEEIKKRFSCNLVVDVFDFSSNMKCYYNGDIEKFRYKFKDKKRCFIVANGPSLKVEDLDLLYSEFCIGMNKIFMVETMWKPDVYVCVDSFLLNEETEKIANYDCSYKFIGDSGEKYWEEPRRNSYKIHVVPGDTYKVLPAFSENIAQKVYSYHTVTHACIQIACYMGFKEIYLVGVDCNYAKGSLNNYLYKCNEKDNLNHNENGMIMAYESAKKYADEHGIKIYNATRGGMLEVFERVDFDSLFDGEKNE